MKELSDSHIDKIIGLLEKGKPLPEHYKEALITDLIKLKHSLLFDTKKEYELIYAGKQGPHADPFIVALAISEGCSVITQESQTKADKIPDICRKYDIKSFSLIGFFTE